mmetsp:Transcript_5132/g.12134  ORF Transcript_5132/g.12134 Transcript_5132/m.12134 type:complete len:316 (+) Transcript_5132:91-1038(+)
MAASLVRVFVAGACALSGLRTGRAEASAGASLLDPAWEAKGTWLGKNSVLLIRNFISKREALSLKSTAEKLFATQYGANWTDATYNLGFLKGGHVVKLVTQDVWALENRIANLTGIPMNGPESRLQFTRQRPGAMPPGEFVRNVHHDKNNRKRRSVTVIVYLTSARSNADGGHTLFPTLPRPARGEGAAADEEDDPVPHFRDTLEAAFRQGYRSIADVSNPNGVQDARTFGMAQRECALALEGRNRALAVRPRRGNALVLWHVRPDGSPNPLAWHAGCHARGGAGRFAAQKFKEPSEGEAFEDAPERGRRAGLEL